MKSKHAIVIKFPPRCCSLTHTENPCSSAAVALKKAMADNFVLICVQQAIIALLNQRCEELRIGNIWQTTDGASEIAVGVGMPCPPTNMQKHLRRLLLPCDHVTRQKRKMILGRQTTQLGEPPHGWPTGIPGSNGGGSLRRPRCRARFFHVKSKSLRSKQPTEAACGDRGLTNASIDAR
ncbi:MAG TPA: hypothetical protein VK512_09170 [Xanthobacteraceae bacterium]|nr:hypothetical protein [Xanthobacteraceae bacterium]